MLVDLMVSRAMSGREQIDMARHADLSCRWNRLKEKIRHWFA